MLDWIKEAINNVGRTLLGGFLIIVAFFLICLTAIPAFIWLTIYSFKRHEGKKARTILGGTAEFLIDIAATIDITGGVMFKGFFTWLFLTKEATYVFGRITDTISYILGYNEKAGTLTKEGKIMVKILDRLDSNHCQKAMRLGIIGSQRKLIAIEQLKLA